MTEQESLAGYDHRRERLGQQGRLIGPEDEGNDCRGYMTKHVLEQRKELSDR